MANYYIEDFYSGNLDKVILGTSCYSCAKSGNLLSISLDGGRSTDYEGPVYKKIAPDRKTLSKYREKIKEINELKEDLNRVKEYLRYRKQIEDEYINNYYRTRLVDLDPIELLYSLKKRYGKDIILLCHEPVEEFCHRRLVADYIELETGLYIPEVSTDEKGLVKKIQPIRYKNRLKKAINEYWY